MSRKRNVENTDMFQQWSMESCLEHDDKEVDEILQSRKIKKRDKNEVIGFCDICEIPMDSSRIPDFQKT